MELKAALEGFEDAQCSDREKTAYALMYADLSQKTGEAEASKKYFKVAEKYTKGLKERLAVYEEIKNRNDEFWIPYLKGSDDPVSGIRLAELYLKREEPDDAYDVLTGINSPDLERKRLMLLGRYYFAKKDFLGVLTISSKVKLDPLNMEPEDTVFVKQLINSCRELRFYSKAEYYLHYLKGAVPEKEFAAMAKLIKREEARFVKDGGGNYITK